MSGPLPVVASDPGTSPPPPGEAATGSEWVLRARYDRLRAALPREVSGRALMASWGVSGFLMGVAVAYVFGWSAGGQVLAGLVTAGLSWLGRGVATVLVAGIVTLSAISVAFYLTVQASADAVWNMQWLFPLSVL